MHRRTIIFTVFLLLFFVGIHSAQATSFISRRDGFVLIWKSTSRAAETTKEKPYLDVPSGADGSREITYAKARGLLDDSQENFYPDAWMSPSDALRWIFRTRSVEPLAMMRHVCSQNFPMLRTFLL